MYDSQLLWCMGSRQLTWKPCYRYGIVNLKATLSYTIYLFNKSCPKLEVKVHTDTKTTQPELVCLKWSDIGTPKQIFCTPFCELLQFA